MAAERQSERPGTGPLDAAPGLARIAAVAGVRTASWYAGHAFRAGRRLTRAVATGESPFELARDARAELIEGARRALGVTDLERQLDRPGPEEADGAEHAYLRRRGEELLRRSASLEPGGPAHPAFERILTQLSPDEARILNLLVSAGPQAAIDVKTWRPLGVGSRVVAPGLTMIGREAGCMSPQRVSAYLANLFRLGLIWFSRDPVPRALKAYQVLEAQPEVLEARKRAGRSRIVRRSVRLTAFGAQFCAAVLPDRAAGPATASGPASEAGEDATDA